MDDPLGDDHRRRLQRRGVLRESLESTCAQKFDAYEVIFVDDGSTDGTAEIARSFAVQYIHQENRGPTAARNAGLELARGRFIAFQDHDDVMPPTKLEVQNPTTCSSIRRPAASSAATSGSSRTESRLCG